MRCRQQSGLSLVEMMVAVGIMSITVLAFASMVNSQGRQIRALNDKMAALDLTNGLIRVVSDNDTCQFMVTNPAPLVFDSTLVGGANPPTLPLNIVYPTPSATGAPVAQVGEPASGLSSSAIIKIISVRVDSGAGNSFAGELLVEFDDAAISFGMRPVSVGISLFTDPGSPANAKVIQGCSAVGVAGGGPELLWGSGAAGVGGGSGRMYGTASLSPGRRFSDYSYIYIVGWSHIEARNAQVGHHGKVHAMIPVTVFSANPGRLFDTQTFSGDDSGTTGIRYLSDTSFLWGTMRAARLHQLWGIP